MTHFEVISDKHYAAIGRAIAIWDDLEFSIDRAIWRIVSKEQAVGSCLTAQYSSVFARLNALISLVELFSLSQAAVKQLRSMLGTLSSMSEERNRIVHDPRFVRKKDMAVGRWRVTAKASLKWGWEEETVETLHDFCVRVGVEQNKVLDIWGPILKTLERSPQLLRARFPRIVMDGLEQLSQPIGNGEHHLLPGSPRRLFESEGHNSPPLKAKRKTPRKSA